MTIDLDAMCHVGMVRLNNEDMLLVDDEAVRDAQVSKTIMIKRSSRLAAMVADGMGGTEGGEFASELAIRLFKDFIDTLPPGLDLDELRHRVAEWVIEAHLNIDSGGGDPDRANMGTTLSGVLFYERCMYWLNIGDSRIYIMRDGLLRQITTDHTLCNLMHDESIPSNVIYNCLGGGGEDVFADFDQLPIYIGDRLLICSDGLSDMLPDNVIAALMQEGAPASHYVTCANNAGGIDNVSVITIDVRE